METVTVLVITTKQEITEYVGHERVIIIAVRNHLKSYKSGKRNSYRLEPRTACWCVCVLRGEDG